MLEGAGPKAAARGVGTPNKMTRALKDMILQALADLGGVAYLCAQAEKNPTASQTLVGKVLPLQMKEALEERAPPESAVPCSDRRASGSDGSAWQAPSRLSQVSTWAIGSLGCSATLRGCSTVSSVTFSLAVFTSSSRHSLFGRWSFMGIVNDQHRDRPATVGIVQHIRHTHALQLAPVNRIAYRNARN
jgi:hypothetical protein